MKKYPFIITVREGYEVEVVAFEEEINAHLAFEEFKKTGQFDLCLMKRQMDGDYEALETYISKKQHDN